MESKKNIAFVGTEFQQNILCTISMQENIKFNLIFIKDKIEINEKLKNITEKIIIFEDIPYSWKNLFTYLRSFKKLKKKLNNNYSYNVYTWSIENPIIKLILNKYEVDSINIFEDGMGSYVQRNINSFILKDYILMKGMNFLLNLFSGRFFNNYKIDNTYALFGGAFPYLKYKKQIILDHNIFKKVLEKNIKKSHINLPDSSVIFLQQSLVEMNILSEQEYIDLHKKIIHYFVKRCNLKEVIWKLHPRTNMKNEKERLKRIVGDYDIKIKLLDKENIENLLIAYSNKNLKIYSFYSSGLYVSKCLLNKHIYAFESKKLSTKILTLNQVYKFFQNIGIKVIKEKNE